MSIRTHRQGGIAKSAGTIGLLTLVSRVLGFVRDILIALFFGTTFAAEAFVVSFKIPNLLRDLVGEGAVNSAIVPVLAQTRAVEGPDGFNRLVKSLAFGFLGVLCAVSVLGVVFAPWVVRLAAPGFAEDPGKMALTVELTRFMFPYIFLIGASALMMGILNSLKNFTSSALGPSLLNLSMIVALWFCVPYWGVHGLIAGVLVGGVLHCLIQAVSIRGIDFGTGNSRPHNHPGVKKILRLLVPRVWGSAVYQTSVFVDTILASLYWIVGSGGQSALYYSSRLFQLPLALFGVSFAQAVLPSLSGHFAKKDLDAFKEATVFCLRQVIFMTLPAAFGLAVFAGVIVRVLFERGAFTEYSTQVTQDALMFYSVGLVSCAVIKVIVSAFYAMQDTRTPVRTAFVSLAVNIVLNLLLMWKFKIGGLALATSLAATVNAGLLWVALKRRLGSFQTGSLYEILMKCGLASVLMSGLLCLVFRSWILDSADAGDLTYSVLKLLTAVVTGAAVYYILCCLMRVKEAEEVMKLIRSAARKT